MGEAHRLVIVHRNRLFRDCLRSVLSSVMHAVVIDHHFSDCVARIVDVQPDVVLVDAALRDHLAPKLIQELRERLPGAKLLALVSVDGQRQLVACMQAGLDGCVPDHASLEELRTAIDAVLSGQAYCTPEVARLIFSQFAAQPPEPPPSAKVDRPCLTSRELQILQLIAAGHSNKQLAGALHLSLYTIKNHVHNILEKLQVHDRHEAVDLAYRRRWLGTPTRADQRTSRTSASAEEPRFSAATPSAWRRENSRNVHR